jgi:hypothetical protein
MGVSNHLLRKVSEIICLEETILALDQRFEG